MAVGFRRGRMPFPTRADPGFQIVHVPQDMTDARAAHRDHLHVALQELRVFRGAVQEFDPALPALLTLDPFDIPRSVRECPRPFKDTDRMAIIDHEIQTAARLQDALELQKPGFDQVVEVREHRARVDEIEGLIGKGQMRHDRGCGEVKRRGQLFLTPADSTRPEIHAPDFCLRRQIAEMANEPPTRDTPFENLSSLLDREAALAQDPAMVSMSSFPLCTQVSTDVQ